MRAIRDEGGHAVAIHADVARPEQVARLFAFEGVQVEVAVGHAGIVRAGANYTNARFPG